MVTLINNNHNLLTLWCAVDINLNKVSKGENADRVMTPHRYNYIHTTHEMTQGQQAVEITKHLLIINYIVKYGEHDHNLL